MLRDARRPIFVSRPGFGWQPSCLPCRERGVVAAVGLRLGSSNVMRGNRRAALASARGTDRATDTKAVSPTKGPTRLTSRGETRQREYYGGMAGSVIALSAVLALSVVPLAAEAQEIPDGNTAARTECDRAAFDAYAEKQRELFQRWLVTVGLGKTITAAAVSATPSLVKDDNQEFVLHLTLNGADTYAEDVAHRFWKALREEFLRVKAYDLEQRLLFRFAHQINKSARWTTVELSRYVGDSCWIVTLRVGDDGYENKEHVCTSVTASATVDSASFAALLSKVSKTVPAPRKLTDVDPKIVTEKTCINVDSRIFCRVTETTTIRAAEQLATVLDGIERRLREHFTSGPYTLVTAEGALREVVVDGIRNEALRDRWERLQISVFAAPLPSGSLQVILIVDGQYAPGFGTKTPALESYRDMEPVHFAALSKYTKALLTKLTRKTP